jgi:SAM-dependent methyltransferase
MKKSTKITPKQYSIEEWDAFFSNNEVIVPFLDVCVFAVKRLRKSGPCSTVYEFGCGMGNNLRFIHQAFPRVRLLGSDISAVAIKKLQDDSIPNSLFWVNDQNLNMRSNEIDLVIERGAMQHVSKEQAKSYLKEIYDSMKIGAEGFFEIASTAHGLYEKLGEVGDDPTVGFRTFYTIGDIKCLFADFKINRIYHLQRDLVLNISSGHNESQLHEEFKVSAQGSFQVEIEKIC